MSSSQPDYRHLEIQPIAGALGAEIHGVDLTQSQPLSDELQDKIKRAFYQYQVIYFRDQAISPEQHLALARLFGPLLRIPHIFNVDGYPELQIVRRKADERDTRVTGGNWHTDSTFMETPPAGVVMRAIEVPPYGGDTLFASMYSAYENLSAKMQELLSGLRAVHSASKIFGSTAQQQSKNYQIQDMAVSDGDKEITHPVVHTHPISGRKGLFINRVYTQRFEGMTVEESQPILNYLFEQSVLPKFTCRVRWYDNTVLIWDNRCTWHRAVPDYEGHDRYLQRVTFAGPRPQ